MDDTVRAALAQTQTIDLTTTGRRSGEPRRIEIVLHNLDGRLVISGMPTPGRIRAWIHNVEADPAVTIHLKGGRVVADIAGTARVVTDPAERGELIAGVARSWNRTDVDVMVEHSPLIVVTLPGYPA
jgi:deazaflavin-dependent oxidoreductase (nitroreductase family)